MTDNRIVAVGFLTQRDLETLGSRFDRAFPIHHDTMFDDLLRRLDDVEAVPVEAGVVLRHARGRAV